MSDDNSHIKFACGSLDEPVPIDTPFVSPEEFYGKKSSAPPKFKVAIDSRIYPDSMNYKYMATKTINQNPYGICYICTACNWCKFAVFLHTGCQFNFTRAEAADVAGDARSLGSDREYADVEGGTQGDTRGLFRFNDYADAGKHGICGHSNHLDVITEFLKICSKNGITEKNVNGPSCGCTKDNCIKTLNNYGPFYWAHNPVAYGGPDGSHAILVVGYDKDYAYFKNSWSSSDNPDVLDQNHYGRCDWENFEKYGRIIGAYNPGIWKNL